MTTVYTLNTSNLNTGNDVEVHSPDCQHLAKYKKDFFFEEGWIDEVETAQEAFNVYNADFYDDFYKDSTECWPVTFYPCSGLVKRKTTLFEYVEDSQITTNNELF